MAHRIEPVTRQRDDQAWLLDCSRSKPDVKKAGISLCTRQLETASNVLGRVKGESAPFIWPKTCKREKCDKRDMNR
ncbi:hypothetical protein FOXYSP1_17369 [Fusarium oxysporum f. sp. phaseoli]